MIGITVIPVSSLYVRLATWVVEDVDDWCLCIFLSHCGSKCHVFVYYVIFCLLFSLNPVGMCRFLTRSGCAMQKRLILQDRQY